MANTKKLSVAAVWGPIDVKELLKNEIPVHVATFWGVAIGSKTGTTNYGEWTALVGQFEGLNPKTGEVASASTLFLPEVAMNPILAQLEVPGIHSVQFALDVIVKPAEKVRPGGSVYEYTYESVLPPSEDDPMQRMRRAIGAVRPAAAKALGFDSAPAESPASAPAESPAPGRTEPPAPPAPPPASTSRKAR